MHPEPRAATGRTGVIGVSIALGAVLLTGCGGEQSPRSQPSRSEPATVTTVAAEPETSVPEKSWKRGQVHIGFPDALVALGGAVYVKTDDGHVVRVDPATGKVDADVKVDTTSNSDYYCEGIGTDGKTLWACSAAADGTTDVVRLDPSTLRVLSTVKVDKLFDQIWLPVAGGRVWTLSGTGQTLTATDTTSNRTTAHPLGRTCLQAAATATTVYVTCLSSNLVIAVDAATGRTTHKATVSGTYNVAVDDKDVWISGSSGIVRLSPALRPKAVYPGLVAGREGDLLLTPGNLWVRQGPDFLSRIDRGTGTVAARYLIDPVPSGGSLAAVGDEIWTSAADDDVVLRVAPAP